MSDRLEATTFPHSITQGFCDPSNCDVAVCLIPGTQIAFDADIRASVKSVIGWETTKTFKDVSTAKFVQVEMSNPYTHHDALELPDGMVILVHKLIEGQRATVLQLPAAPKTAEESKEQERAAYV